MSDWEEYNDVNPQNNASSSKNDNSTSRRRDHYGQSKGRENFRNSGDGNKSDRRYEQIMDLRSDWVGMVIGKGGSNIQRLQNNYGVRINIEKGSCRLTASGNDEWNIKSVLKEIEEQIEKFDNRDVRGERNSYKNRFNEPGQSTKLCTGSEERNDNNSSIEVGFRNRGSNHNDNDIIDWDAINKRSEKAREEKWAACPPLTKQFYKEAPEVTALSIKDVQRIRMENNNTSVERLLVPKGDSNEKIPNPIWEFEQCFAAYPDLLAEIKKMGFQKPSPIQSQAWPILLKGEDMIGIAQTGTGKTLAFLLPALIHTEYQSTPRSQRGGPNVLVMAPTRELALQIEKEVNKYQFRGMKAVCVYGGGNRRDQIGRIESGVEIIISTPGRLNDLIQAKVIDVSSITYLVLDEADRMLDMGFEPQILKILLNIRPDRQTVMTSATWPVGVRRLAQKYMTNPIQVCVGSLDLAATHTVCQIIEIMEEEDKYSTLKRFIMNMNPDDKIIVFCSRKAIAVDLSSDLGIEGFSIASIHGSLEQYEREQAIADITSGEVKILIATDVASRGLDIDDVTHVINYNCPPNIEEYVHRVGRTGRAGRTGMSISYVTRSDWALASKLISILEEAGQHVPEELHAMAERFAKKMESKNNYRGQRSFGYGGGGGQRYRN